uniref:Ig-like domain-containing protein n=1 Tax=Cyprinus carpio TaxID=7962 RepID=A0A8C2GJY8_CYPCA
KLKALKSNSNLKLIQTSHFLKLFFRTSKLSLNEPVLLYKQRRKSEMCVHTWQNVYGCEWDDQTGEKNGFDQFGYDGEDFVSLDWKEGRFISPVQQGLPTVQKWNDESGFLGSDKNYLGTLCIESLQKYVQYRKSSLQKTVSPQVSLLQKSPSSPVTCHATGFFPSGVTISWEKNGQEHHEDVDLGELLPNEDGTFQRTSTIRVTPEEWKNNKFSCVVEHQGKTKTENEIRTNPEDSVPIGIIVGALAAVVLLVIIGVAGYMVYQKKKGSDDGSNSSAHTVPQA